MVRCIRLDPRMEKCLSSLRRAGKKAILAAAKAEAIIDRLQSGEGVAEPVGNLTKHGENRIRGMTKYDLGNGYRLVTYRQGEDLFVLFAGTHDECHRWIENNRELTCGQIESRCTAIPVEREPARPAPLEFAERDEPEDPFVFSRIDENLLRIVFCGLAEKSPRQQVDGGPHRHLS